MSLPITLSNYAIPFSEDSTPIVVSTTTGFVITNFSVTGFARRSCIVSSFEVYCEEPAVVIQMDLNGIGLQDYYADLVDIQGDFYDQATTSPEWLTFKKVGEHRFLFTTTSGLDVEMIGIYGDGHIDNVTIDIPAIQSNGDSLRQIPLSFYVNGYDLDGSVSESGVIQLTVSDALGSSSSSDERMPRIQYIENLASRVNTGVEVVLHGRNFLQGMNVYISQGETVYTVPSNDVVFSDDGKVASFLLAPGMLLVDGDGLDECGTYEIHIGFDELNLDRNNLGLIRYKYDELNLAEQQKTPARFTGVGVCFAPSDMSLVYDTTDEYGNGVSNPAAGPLGNTLYVRVDGDCTRYKYVPVRLKLNYSLSRKYGESYVNGVQLLEGDIVWLTHQVNPDEDGLWVVSKGEWHGYGDVSVSETDQRCPEDCYRKPKPAKVDDTFVIDLGARVFDTVDYVCSDDVPFKCGRRTACSYNLKPGDIVLLSNQKDGMNGIWYVTCGDWMFMGPPDANDGTRVDVSRSLIVQTDIDFCKCGETYHIDYYYLNSSCYVNHMRREVKLLCSGGASIVPNNADHQVSISEYSVTVGEADELVGYRGRTPGDPVKETCMKTEPDFEFKAGMEIVENLQDVPCCAIECLKCPDGTDWCDIPKFYNIRMTDDYKNSNDTNGFTIKFWRHEFDGWHLYAYIASGTSMSGMDYYVYHLHVKGAATERLVDVNEHSWFGENGGVLATGDTDVIQENCGGSNGTNGCERIEIPVFDDRLFTNSFALCDDTWQLPYTELDPLTLEEETRYSTNLDSDEKLYSLWQIKCTTTILGHRAIEPQGDLDQRLNCADMDDAVRNALATGSPEQPGYIAGMRHVWGFNYYKSVMSKQQFCDEYNKYDNQLVYSETEEALATDSVDVQGNLYEAIATDRSVDEQEMGMDETVISLRKIYDLPRAEGADDNPARIWLPVTQLVDSNHQNGGRKTVRVPFPVGDYEVACEFCRGTGKEPCPVCGGNGLGPVCDHCGGSGIEPNQEPVDECDESRECTVCHANDRYRDGEGLYHVPCESCSGNGEIECTHCHGLGIGVMTVTPNGVIQLRYDDDVFEVNKRGLTIKVDNETIKVGPNGLEVNAEAIVPPTAFVTSSELKVESTIVVPKYTTIIGHNMTVAADGRIFANSERVRGFRALLRVDIEVPSYESCSSLIPYHIEVVGGTGEWDFVVDTTTRFSGFVATTLVTDNVMDGIQFKVTKTLDRGEAVPTGYTEEFSLDVHSF